MQFAPLVKPSQGLIPQPLLQHWLEFGGVREGGKADMELVEGEGERKRVCGGGGYYFSKAPGTLISCNTQSILINKVELLSLSTGPSLWDMQR